MTGEPLEILHVALPPGSMVSAAAHMPHGVEPRKVGRGTRLCTLFAYAKPDPLMQLVRSSERRAGGYAGKCESPLDFICCRHILASHAASSHDSRATIDPPAVSPELLAAARAGKIPTVQAGERNIFTMY